MYSFQDNDTKSQKMLKSSSSESTGSRLSDWTPKPKKCWRLTNHTKYLYPELNLSMLRTSLTRKVPEIWSPEVKENRPRKIIKFWHICQKKSNSTHPLSKISSTMFDDGLWWHFWSIKTDPSEMVRPRKVNEKQKKFQAPKTRKSLKTTRLLTEHRSGSKISSDRWYECWKQKNFKHRKHKNL